MSDTPRTDKEIFVVVAGPDVDLETVDADFARTLERENAALRAAIGESEEFARKNGETAGAKIKELLRENAALQEALACLLDWGLQPPDYWRDQTKDRFIADIQKASNLLKRKEAQP